MQPLPGVGSEVLAKPALRQGARLPHQRPIGGTASAQERHLPRDPARVRRPRAGDVATQG